MSPLTDFCGPFEGWTIWGPYVILIEIVEFFLMKRGIIVTKWQVTRLGSPTEAMTLVDAPPPDISEEAILIRVRAAALNFFDILLCQGTYQEKPPLPFTPGAEIAGDIIRIGEKVRGFQPGDRVIALPPLPHGGLTEMVAVPQSLVFPMPQGMNWNEAAALFITYQTALYALTERGRLAPGEMLLVHAGAGGVGSAAIQLGRALGARVAATAGGPEKTAVCRQLGADPAIDYESENFIEVIKQLTEGRGADVIFDPVGGDVFDQSRRAVAFDGRILVIGFAGGRIPQAPANHILVKNYSVVGVHWGLWHRLFPQRVRQAHDTLAEYYRRGAIHPLISREVPFEEAPAALEALGRRKTWGKVIVKVHD